MCSLHGSLSKRSVWCHIFRTVHCGFQWGTHDWDHLSQTFCLSCRAMWIYHYLDFIFRWRLGADRWTLPEIQTLGSDRTLVVCWAFRAGGQNLTSGWRLCENTSGRVQTGLWSGKRWSIIGWGQKDNLPRLQEDRLGTGPVHEPPAERHIETPDCFRILLL